MQTRRAIRKRRSVPSREREIPAESPERQEKEAQVFSALGSGPRARIMEAITIRPKGIQDLVDALRIPRATLRYHLAVLQGQGLIMEAVHRGARRIGRPAKVYRAAQHVAVAGYPKRRYDLLGDLVLRALVEEVGEDRAIVRLRRAGREVGESLIRQLGSREGFEGWTPETFERVVVDGHFREHGAPSEVIQRSEDSLIFRTFHCPFLEIAEKMPRFVCDGLDAGLHQGIDAALGAVRTERTACMGHGAPYCEYRMRWASSPRRQE